jgi:predicted MPP superfamily phosphohydrolase
MSFGLFLFLFLLVPDLLWWRWADRRARGRPLLRAAVGLFAAAMAGHILWILFRPAEARRAHHWLPMSLVAATYLWHVVILPLTLLLLGIRGGVGLALRRGRTFDPSRRGFLAGTAAAVAPLATGAVTVFSFTRLHDLRVRRLEVRVPNLPPALDGLRIAHVSDLHYGKFTTRAFEDRVVETVNALPADLVLFTGDLIDVSLADLDAAIALVRRFDPRRGLFLCEGNHDLFDSPGAFRARVRAAELALLDEEAASVEVRGAHVQLFGARWGRGDEARAASVRRALAARAPGAFPILLAHHPHAFDAAEGVPLTLAGHTHGGQLMLSERLGPGPVLYRYWSGLYERNGRALVVSNGVGNWFPLRTSAPAEVVDLILRA